MEERLEERISALGAEAGILTEQVTALEAENQQLRAQAEPFCAAVPRQTYELWIYAEAQRDLFKSLWEVGTVIEAAYEKVRVKAREAHVYCGYDVATLEAGKDAGDDNEEPYGDDGDNGGDGAE